MSNYNGFSTISSKSQKKFVLTDNDLIKQDLLNAFKVRRGTRVMQPNFGCIAWEKLFETITPSDVQDISENFTAIVNNDPRVNLISIDVNPSINNLTITLLLRYVSTNQLEQLILTYEQNMDNF